MAAVLFRERTVEVDAWLERRRALELDRYDEVWDGVYVVNPAPDSDHGEAVMVVGAAIGPAVRRAGLALTDATNVGTPDDYRIPDLAVFDRQDRVGAYLRRVVVAFEISSPGEDVEAKLPFYLAAGVAEVVVIDRSKRSIRWLVAGPDGWTDVVRSAAIDASVDDLRAALGWD